MKRKLTTYAEKMQQTNREARATVVALLVIALAWFVGGIGLSHLDIEVFSTPIWIIGGTVGTWIVAVAAAIILAKVVFANFSLDDDEEGHRG